MRAAKCRARRMLVAHKDSARARLESDRDDRVEAQNKSARTRLESGRDGAKKDSALLRSRREAGRDGARKDSALTRSHLESGRTAPIQTRREHAWSRAGRTELKPKETRRRHTLSRAGTIIYVATVSSWIDVFLDQNHVRSFSLSFLRQQRDRATFQSDLQEPVRADMWWARRGMANGDSP